MMQTQEISPVYSIASVLACRISSDMLEANSVLVLRVPRLCLFVPPRRGFIKLLICLCLPAHSKTAARICSISIL